jgi:hypothetical protein
LDVWLIGNPFFLSQVILMAIICDSGENVAPRSFGIFQLFASIDAQFALWYDFRAFIKPISLP